MRARSFWLCLPLVAHVASAQQPSSSGTKEDEIQHQRLRDRYGVEVAARLIRSVDVDERIRGIERAAAMAAPLAAGPDACKPGASEPICEEAKRALELLTPTDSPGSLRGDGRSMLSLARALAPFAVHAQARIALVGLVNAPPPSLIRGRDDNEPDLALRAGLARGTAAMALASSKDARAIDALLGITRSGGVGQVSVVPALAAYGLSPWSPQQGAPTSPVAVNAILQSGDLRALDPLRVSAKSSEPTTRSAALLAMAQLGDGRAVELARAAIGEKDARVRQAAAEAFVLLDAGERFRAVEALIADEVTAPAGVRLAQRVQDAGVVRALAARVVATADHGLRQEIVAALGRGTPLESIAVLQALAERDPTLETDIAQAYARSPSAGAMSALEKMASIPSKKRLALRAYFVRRYLRSETSDRLDGMLNDAARSKDPKDRAVAVPALVTLGKTSFASALDDPDPGVRRAVAMTALAQDDLHAANKALLAKHAAEKDAVTKAVLSGGLRDGDPDGVVTTSTLIDRAESGSADAPLAALALAQRVDDQLLKKVDALLASPVASIRMHAATGLAKSKLPSTIGKLAGVWEFEVDPEVRRVVISGLADNNALDTPIGRRAIESTAKLDPDGDVRTAAKRVLDGYRVSSSPSVVEVAWLRAATADGSAPPKGLTGTLVPRHGLAIPFAFDDEGFALIPGIPIGEANVVLSPRVPGGKP